MGAGDDHREQGVLDALPDGVVVADASGSVTLVNSAAVRLLGQNDGIGKHLSDVVLLQDRAGNSWFSCTDPYGGLATRSRMSEQAWYLSDGTELLVTARIEREAPRSPVRRVAVSLRSARARERLDRERSDLVATVAHELRSPLTGVKGFAATLLSKWDKLNDDQKKMMLETVNADADRLTRLIAELLDVARIDTGRLSLYPRPVDLGPRWTGWSPRCAPAPDGRSPSASTGTSRRSARTPTSSRRWSPTWWTTRSGTATDRSP